ncbi:TPA: DUF4165 domain-containing protein [Escherichia coli]|nr:DUF4165 domain-containing protein [Escherichia coli]MCA4093044.1 DUF4165 domain-containing protein [Escherichia coli]MDL4428690.1 DUF4165 domain-containing protein [Escherichia coli]
MLGALAVLTAGAAHAELLEYTFKAPDGTQRSLTPNANYANPTGNISFALSAGIDRKVKISVSRIRNLLKVIIVLFLFLVSVREIRQIFCLFPI